MFKNSLILYFLLTVSTSSFGQNDSLKVFLGQNDNFIEIDKTKITIKDSNFSSAYYNFTLSVPALVKSLNTYQLPNSCIFTISTNYSDFGFWVSQYENMRYSKAYCKRMLTNSQPFKLFYRELIFKKGPLSDGKFISDSVRSLEISGIQAIQYLCYFEKNNFKGEMIMTQLFYKNFNYRIVCTIDNQSNRKDVAYFLNDLLINSFRLLKTDE